MTPALKAMVEAMKAEIVRQVEASSEGERASSLDDGRVWIDGPVDLEKVARAGLAAIRWPEDADAQMDIILAGADVPDSVARFWPPMIDAILKDTK